MSVELFMILLIAGCSISIVLTEAVKKFLENSKKDSSANVIAFINAFIVGCLGMIGSYIVLEISFTAANIVAIIAMVILIWIGAMVGYDKAIQLVTQLNIKKN